jgi:hypothetical protein
MTSAPSLRPVVARSEGPLRRRLDGWQGSTAAYELSPIGAPQMDAPGDGAARSLEYPRSDRRRQIKLPELSQRHGLNP